jgi:hypothetical protein
MVIMIFSGISQRRGKQPEIALEINRFRHGSAMKGGRRRTA